MSFLDEFLSVNAELKAENQALRAKLAEAEAERDRHKNAESDMREFHTAAMKDAYELLGIDGSDGEYRYKWVALEISALKAKLAEAEKDAARYRWLRKIVSSRLFLNGWWFVFPSIKRDVTELVEADLDAAIDAEMKK